MVVDVATPRQSVPPLFAGVLVSIPRTARRDGCEARWHCNGRRSTPRRRTFPTSQPPAGSWQIVQDYGALATYTWNTAGAAAGTYRYSVWVRDASSLAGYDTYFPGTAYTLS